MGLVGSGFTVTTFGVGQKALMFMQTTGGGSSATYFVALPLVGTNIGSAIDEFQTTQLVRAYGDPGTDMLFLVSRNSGTGDAIATVSISGHLVDCGSGSGCPVP